MGEEGMKNENMHSSYKAKSKKEEMFTLWRSY